MILLLLAFFYWLFFTPTFAIERINIRTNQILSHKTIAEIIKKQVGERRWRFARQDNLFAFNVKKLQDELRNEFNAERAYIKKDRPHDLAIIISGKPWLAIWSARGNYYSLDEQGAVLGQLDGDIKADFYSKPIIYSQDYSLPMVRDRVLNNATFAFMNQLLQNAYIRSLQPQFFIVDRAESNNLNLKVQDGWKINFDTAGDLVQQVHSLSLLLHNSISPDKQKQLEYIDLRFGQQVYYKLR